MTNITLNGTAAVQIQQGTAAGFSLQNNGPGNVYLANDASVSPSTGYVVQPGVSLPLNANAVLYGCTDNGTTAAIQLLQGATATQATIVEANVPNAVNVSGSVAITNATVPVSGNVSINNASIPVTGNVGISGGTVNVTGSSVSVAGSVPTLAGSAATIIASGTPGFGTAAQTPATSLFNSGALNVSAYTAIVIAVTGGFAAGGPASINAANYITADIFQNSGPGLNFAPIHAEWLLDTSMTNVLVIPVVSNSITVSLAYAKAATAVGGTVNVTVYGTSQPVPGIQYVSNSALLVGTCAEGGYYTNTQGVGSHSDFISSRNGEAAVNIYGSGSAGNAVVNVLSAGVGYGIAALYTATAAPADNGENVIMRFPLAPIRIDRAVQSGSNVFSVVQ